MGAEEGIFLVEITPAVALAAHKNTGPKAGALVKAHIDLSGNVAVGGADHGADLGAVEAVLEIVCLQLVRGGDGDGTQLVEREDGEPELIRFIRYTIEDTETK